jgi:hypothetical protein
MNRSLKMMVLFTLVWGSLGGAYAEPSKINLSDWDVLGDPFDFGKPWEFRSEGNNGLKIYFREFPGSDIFAAKSESWINAPFKDSVALIMMVDDYMAFPVTDRDGVTSMQWIQDPETKAVTFYIKSAHDVYPVQEGFLRIPKTLTTWTLIPESKNRTRSIWQSYNDPGGWLPAWVINWVLEKVIKKSSETKDQQVVKDKYKNAVVEGLVLPDFS